MSDRAGKSESTESLWVVCLTIGSNGKTMWQRFVLGALSRTICTDGANLQTAYIDFFSRWIENIFLLLLLDRFLNVWNFRLLFFSNSLFRCSLSCWCVIVKFTTLFLLAWLFVHVYLSYSRRLGHRYVSMFVSDYVFNSNKKKRIFTGVWVTFF